MVKIFIDPGHGGTDPGAAGNGLYEKNLTLQIAKRIQSMLSAYQNTQVKLSRDSDQTVSLNQRTNMANAWGADFLLSVHINSGGGTGFEDYIHPTKRSTSANYQKIIHEETLKQIGLTDRGSKSENFHMVRESNMPAILTENGFIDNPSDAAKLSQSSYIERIARGHVNGLARAFNLKEKTTTNSTGNSVVKPKPVEKQPTQERKLSGMIPNWAEWQWEAAVSIYRKARENGVLSSDKWEKKAAAKKLTFDEIAFLNLVLIGRQKK